MKKTKAAKIVLHGRQGTGSAVCEALLELAGIDFTLKQAAKRPDGSPPKDLLAVNPLGQVPALVTAKGIAMTESAAITLWIADLVPDKKLAPAISDPKRAEYLRWMVFMAANCYMTGLRFYYPDRYTTDPKHAAAVAAQAKHHADAEWAILTKALGSDDFLLGKKLCAADVYLAMLVSWEDDFAQFSKSFPKLASHSLRVAKNRKIAAVWKRHGFRTAV